MDRFTTDLVLAYNQAGLLWRILGYPGSINANDDNFAQVVDAMLNDRLDGQGWRNSAGEATDHPAVTAVKNARVGHAKALGRVGNLCEFTQTERVLDTCEAARVEENISVIAVNMAPEDEETVEVTKACIFGKDDAAQDRQTNQPQRANMLKTKRLPNGLTVQLSDDEQSVYAEVKSLDDLRYVLATMTPEGTSRRSVRLVN
ncbi:MAG: hypothetical protein AAFP97_04870 [Pseudomonadota bacterium]